jgi:chaperonin GroEL (HSP60 family)
MAEEKRLGEDKMVFIKECKDPKSVAILVRAGLERLVDEAERTLNDCLSVVADVIKKNKIVAGGGAIEIELAKRLKEYATNIGGREQLAVEAFADALESIPRVLSENAGLDPIDIIVALRSAHEKKDGVWMGVNVYTGKVEDMQKLGVVEPLNVKEQAIKSAVEAASMILRVDDVILSAKPPPMPPKGGEGMPEY